jgi:hypothetical protein
VLILGKPHFREFTRLRDALADAVINRVPDVQIVTVGGTASVVTGGLVGYSSGAQD